ncbi:hypothetical protein F1880_001738 [Penicillium rolfsii]|nr:hypothetical protein F1880_001738 [Penicillium rolfsii]
MATRRIRRLEARKHAGAGCVEDAARGTAAAVSAAFESFEIGRVKCDTFAVFGNVHFASIIVKESQVSTSSAGRVSYLTVERSLTPERYYP